MKIVRKISFNKQPKCNKKGILHLLQVMKISSWAAQCFCWNFTDLCSDDEKGFIDLDTDKEAAVEFSVNWVMKNNIFSLKQPVRRVIQICVTFVVVVIMAFGITGEF